MNRNPISSQFKTAFSATLLLLVSADGAAAAEKPELGSKRAALENACLFQDEMEGSKTRRRVRAVWTAVKEKAGLEDSPLCSLKTVPELLLVTAAYLGEAGLSVAQGLDKAEQALGLKRSLLREIAELEAALAGQKLADQLVDRTVVLSSTIGESTKRIEEELEKMERGGYLTEEAKQLIARSRTWLSRARYFQVQTLAGAAAVQRKFEEASEEEKTSWILHPEVGITGDFLKQAPKRILQAVKDLERSLALAGKIDEAGRRLDFKVAQKEIKESNKNARRDAVELAENLSFTA